MKDQINLRKLPRHIAIIMDGNGRWARQKGRNRIFGHRNGVKAVRETVESAAELGVGYLTLYAFSTENWNRPRKEISALMELLVHTIGGETKTLTRNNIRLRAIGDLDSLPARCRRELKEAVRKTAGGSRMTLILALSYSARWEIARALRAICRAALEGEVDPRKINEDTISACLTTSEFPDPELLIRTSGERRISNFLLWQIAYTELYFTDKLWPDFRKEDLYAAIMDYQRRERRFGKTSEQLVG